MQSVTWHVHVACMLCTCVNETSICEEEEEEEDEEEGGGGKKKKDEMLYWAMARNKHLTMHVM